MSVEKLSASFAPFGFSIPLPAVGHVFSGFEYLGMILVTAIPFGIYDLVEAPKESITAEHFRHSSRDQRLADTVRDGS
jgi:adenine/guanine/hypoxanthine permease